MKSKVHTGANNQFGGLKEGLFIVLYQAFTELEVKNEPINPTIKGANVETINFLCSMLWNPSISIFFIVFIFMI